MCTSGKHQSEIEFGDIDKRKIMETSVN